MTPKKKKKSKKKKELAKAELQARRRKAMDLTHQGVKQADIAKQFGVSRKTISKDLQIMREELAEELGELDTHAILAQLRDSQASRLRRYWLIVGDEKATRRDKIRALDSLRDEEKEMVKRMQMTGLLPRNTDGVQINTVGATKVELHIGDYKEPEEEE